MIRQMLRGYLTEGVLEIPRLSGLLQGGKLVDISEGRVSYHPRELPKIHVAIGSETSEETTNQFEKLSRSATLTISIFVNEYNPEWKTYRSYYFKNYPRTRGGSGSYTEDTKDQLRVDLEEVSQEIEYRLRRQDPVAHVAGLTSFALNQVQYNIDETTSPVTGIISHDYQIGYFQ